MKTRPLGRVEIVRAATLGAIVLPCITGRVAFAQTYPILTLATFNGTNGQAPQGQVAIDSNGDVYGTTTGGGTDGDGTVFEVKAGKVRQPRSPTSQARMDPPRSQV